MLSRDELQQIFFAFFALEFLMLMGYLAVIIEHFYNENQFVVKILLHSIDTHRLDWLQGLDKFGKSDT